MGSSSGRKHPGGIPGASLTREARMRHAATRMTTTALVALVLLTPAASHATTASWTIVPSPNPSGSSLPNELFAVTAVAADDVWAVGQTGFPWKALILHWQGSAWTAVPNPCGVPLNGVTAISSTDIWAVGSASACHF